MRIKINNEIIVLLIILLVFLVLYVRRKNENFDKNDDLICGIKDDEQLWCAWGDIKKEPKWHNIKGKVKHVSLTGENNLYVIGDNGDLYFRNDYLNDYANPINWSIRNVPGSELPKFIQITTDKNVICGVSDNGQILCYDTKNLIDPKWIQIESPEEKTIKNISLKNNKIFAITEDNEIYFKENYIGGDWKLLSNSLTKISFDKNLVCGIDVDGLIHCFDNERISNPNWVKIDENKKFNDISVYNNELIGVDSNNEIFMRKHGENEWKKLPGIGLQQISMLKKEKLLDNL
jgi:hypothetical protein